MEWKDVIQAGMYQEETFTVEVEDTAEKVGSGGFGVLATPSMVAYAERLAYRMLQDRLPSSYSSVGMYVELHHLAPTPQGVRVTMHCRVVEVQERRIVFAIEAHDTKEKVGEGRHIRVIVEKERFRRKIADKSGAESAPSPG